MKDGMTLEERLDVWDISLPEILRDAVDSKLPGEKLLEQISPYLEHFGIDTPTVSYQDMKQSEVLAACLIRTLRQIEIMQEARKRSGVKQKYSRKDEEAYDLHKKGMSCRAISKELGIPSATISRMIKRREQYIERKKLADAYSAGTGR